MILHHNIVFFFQFKNKTSLLNRVLVYFADNQEFKGKIKIRA